MTEEIKKNLLCKNCIYFRQHYIISVDRFEKLTSIGHCRHSLTTNASVVCRHWKNIKKLKTKYRTAIKKTLTEMHSHIDQMIQILQDDND